MNLHFATRPKAIVDFGTYLLRCNAAATAGFSLMRADENKKWLYFKRQLRQLADFLPPTSRFFRRQLDEKYSANLPKSIVNFVISVYNTDTTNGNEVF